MYQKNIPGDFIHKGTLIRSLTPLIALGFIFNSFAIFNSTSFLDDASAEINGPALEEDAVENITGDWIIEDGDEIIYRNQTVNLTGNLSIRGSLTLSNVTLRFNCTSDGQYGIYVENGGSLVLKDNDNKWNTTQDGCNITAINKDKAFLFQVKEGTNFTMKHSGLSYCGYSSSSEKRGLYIQTNKAKIIGNYMYKCYYGIYLYKSENTWIERNYFNSSGNCDVYLQESNINKITNNTCYDCRYGIILYKSNNNLVDNNSNVEHYSGISLSDSSSNIVSKNTCKANSNAGIVINSFSFENTVENNTCNSNGGAGIYLHIYSRGTMISNNTCNSNGKYGISVRKSRRNVIGNNTLCSNNENGIYIYDEAENNEVVNNTCNNNRYGIEISEKCHETRVLNNTFIQNSRDGIYVFRADNNYIDNNTCSFSRMSDGIQIWDSDHNKIKNNICNNNDARGIYFLGEYNTIFHNTCNNNDKGIDMEGTASQYSLHNSLTNNIIILNNRQGIDINNRCRYNAVHNNDIVRNNQGGVQATNDQNNIENKFDNGSKGNFWSDYTSRYPGASNNGVVWDLPYALAVKGSDTHPLVYAVNDRSSPILDRDNSWENATTGDKFGFSANITDDIMVVEAWVRYTFDHNEFHNLSLVWRGMDTWSNSTVLSINGTYLNYSFSALDAGGHRVGFENRNISICDNDPPELVSDNTNVTPTTGDVHEFAANFTDNMGMNGANINYTFDDGIYFNQSLYNSLGDMWNLTLVIPSWATYVRYHYYYEDISDNGNVTQVKTLDIIDNDLPVFLMDETPSHPTTGDEFTFSARFTDNVHIMEAWVKHTFDSVNFINKTMTNEHNDTWALPVIIDPGASNLTYSFHFMDHARNLNSTSPQTLAIHDNDGAEILFDNTPQMATTGDIMTFSVVATDNIGVHSIHVRYTFDNITFRNLSMVYTADHIWNLTIIIDPDASWLRYGIFLLDVESNARTIPEKVVSIKDNDKPFFLTNNAPPYATTGDNFTFSITVADNTEVLSCQVRYSYDNISYHSSFLTYVSEDRWNHTELIMYNARNLWYHFLIRDNASNLNVTPMNIVEVYDNDLPVFAGDNSTLMPTTGDYFIFLNLLKDNLGVAHAQTNCSFYKNSYILSNMTMFDLGRWEASVKIPMDAKTMEYHFFFEDVSGNCNVSPVYACDVLDNDNPTALAGEDRIVPIGETVLLNGTDSMDNIGISNYSWSFRYNGERITLYGETIAFVFNRSNHYSIELLVTDPSGNQASDTVNIYVEAGGTEEENKEDDGHIDDDEIEQDDSDDSDNEEKEDEKEEDKDETSDGNTFFGSDIQLWSIIPLILIALIVVIYAIMVIIKRKKSKADIKPHMEDEEEEEKGEDKYGEKQKVQVTSIELEEEAERKVFPIAPGEEIKLKYTLPDETGPGNKIKAPATNAIASSAKDELLALPPKPEDVPDIKLEKVETKPPLPPPLDIPALPEPLDEGLEETLPSPPEILPPKDGGGEYPVKLLKAEDDGQEEKDEERSVPPAPPEAMSESPDLKKEERILPPARITSERLATLEKTFQKPAKTDSRVISLIEELFPNMANIVPPPKTEPSSLIDIKIPISSEPGIPPVEDHFDKMNDEKRAMVRKLDKMIQSGAISKEEYEILSRDIMVIS